MRIKLKVVTMTRKKRWRMVKLKSLEEGKNHRTAVVSWREVVVDDEDETGKVAKSGEMKETSGEVFRALL